MTAHRDRPRSPFAPRQVLASFVFSLVVASVLAAGGCAHWDWRGKGYERDDGRIAERMRPKADPQKFSGLDQRARDIERNLGVR